MIWKGNNELESNTNILSSLFDAQLNENILHSSIFPAQNVVHEKLLDFASEMDI